MAKQIKQDNGVLSTEDGQILTNYVPTVVAAVMEFGCMQGIVVQTFPADCAEETVKK